ncbi:MAG: class I SAM-dependent methyltransferase [Chloroflexota bacterium]
MRPNFSFDKRVAGRYNRQRAHPKHVSEQIGRSIVDTVNEAVGGDSGPSILEVGYGTGRIGIPVATSGGKVTGFDLSFEMMTNEVNREEATGAAVDLAQADMHFFPFPNQTFDAVLCVHVLHLAQDWRKVFQEMRRSVKLGGLFIRGSDWLDPESVLAKFRDELRAHVLRLMPNAMPPAALVSTQEMQAEFAGLNPQTKTAAEWRSFVSPRERLNAIETKTDNESWFLPPPMHSAVLSHMQQWAAETWNDLDEPLPVTRRFKLTYF